MALNLANYESALAVLGFGLMGGSGAPTGITAKKGTLYINTAGTTTNDRIYINTDGGTTWTYVTCGA